MAREKFIGFSTVGKLRPSYKLTDIDLVKQDLENYLRTRKGERVMRPNYGSNLHSYLFEPFDEITKNNIEDSVLLAIESEPRVTSPQINVKETDHGFRISIELTFLPSYTVDQLSVEFNRENEDAE